MNQWFRPADWNFSTRAAGLLALHATSSISLTILNKLIATAFPHVRRTMRLPPLLTHTQAFTLIFIQNVATVFLTAIVVGAGWLELKPFQSSHAYRVRIAAITP